MAAPDFKIPIICGPTGSGKSSAAISFSEKYPIEIVSADSRQIIKQLNIGTAKPTAAEQELVKYHLIDIIEPGERYSAFDFINGAEKALASIINNRKIPVIVGGTGLYLRALSEGVVEIEQDDLTIRQGLEEDYDKLGAKAMHIKLEQIDPLEAAKIHPNNRLRVIRALEIFYLSGKCKSELVTTGAYRKSKYHFSFFCLTPPRDQLYENINNRVDKMLESGLLDEIDSLIKNGWSDKLRKAAVIGYSEWLDFHDDKLTYDEAITLIKQNSRRYAKRQMTWFRKQKDCKFYSNSKELLIDLTKEIDNMRF